MQTQLGVPAGFPSEVPPPPPRPANDGTLDPATAATYQNHPISHQIYAAPPTQSCPSRLAISASLNTPTIADTWQSEIYDSLEPLSCKSLLSRSTVADLFLKTLLIPARGDTYYELLRFCPHASKEGCKAYRGGTVCDLLHYKKLIQPHTGERLSLEHLR